MSIYITGDCHGDWERFSPDIFPEQQEMSEKDFVIVAGDFGLWHSTERERKRLEELNARPFTTLFIDGNHENFDRLNSGEFETVDFCGGRADKIRKKIYHLRRGHIFTLQGHTFLAFGGAKSHDIADGILDPAAFSTQEAFRRERLRWTLKGRQFRIKNISWWEEEMPTREEMDFAKKNLAAYGNKVDFILTHEAPHHVLSVYANGRIEPNPLSLFLNELDAQAEFIRWFFGHHHDDKAIMTKYILLYRQIIRIV